MRHAIRTGAGEPGNRRFLTAAMPGAAASPGEARPGDATRGNRRFSCAGTVSFRFPLGFCPKKPACLSTIRFNNFPRFGNLSRHGLFGLRVAKILFSMKISNWRMRRRVSQYCWSGRRCSEIWETARRMAWETRNYLEAGLATFSFPGGTVRASCRVGAKLHAKTRIMKSSGW